jgi:hypothetical protein
MLTRIPHNSGPEVENGPKARPSQPSGKRGAARRVASDERTL